MPGGPAVVGDTLTISDPSRRSGRIPTGASLEGGRIGPGFLVGYAIVLSAWQPRATRISSRRPDRWWSGGDSEVLEHPSDDDGITEEGDHRHASPTPCTEERVDEEDPVEKLRPAQRSAAGGRGLRGIGLGIRSGGRGLDPLGKRARRW